MIQKHSSSKPTALALLFLLFILPGCLALLFYQHPQWLGGQTTNHGQFISPMIKLDSLNQQKWHLLLISDQACDSQCLTQLDKLARLRLALGRLSRKVDLRLMVTEKSLLPNNTIRKQMEEIALASQVLSPIEKQLLIKRRYQRGVFIVDPHGYMILSYPLDMQQKPIYKDLKHLIKVARQ